MLRSLPRLDRGPLLGRAAWIVALGLLAGCSAHLRPNATLEGRIRGPAKTQGGATRGPWDDAVVSLVPRQPPAGAAKDARIPPAAARKGAPVPPSAAPKGTSARPVASAPRRPGKPVAAPPTMHVRHQANRFLPRVVSVVAGTRVEFHNADRVYHGIFSVSPARRFDLGTFGPGQSRGVVFDRPGIVQVFCSLHPTASGYVCVLPSDLYTRPDSTGTFRFARLAPGAYTLRVWHPVLGELKRQVVAEARGALVELKY